MKKFPDRHNYLRDQDAYGMAELCAYAQEILTRTCADTAYNTRLVTSWENEDEKVTLVCQNLSKKHPVYQMNVESKTTVWPEEYIYMMQGNVQSVGIYAVNVSDGSRTKIENQNPQEVIGYIMGCIRRKPDTYPEEPLNNSQTERQFRNIMANLAIDSAIDEGLFDLKQFAADYEAGSRALNEPDTAAIMAQGITIGDMPFGFTHSDEKLYELVSGRIVDTEEQMTSWQSPPQDSSRPIDYDR